MKYLVIFLLVALLMTACGLKMNQSGETTYVSISAEEAKNIMDHETGYIILDVRAQSEYDEGHIPGAILIPDSEIKGKAESVLTDKDQLILV